MDKKIYIASIIVGLILIAAGLAFASSFIILQNDEEFQKYLKNVINVSDDPVKNTTNLCYNARRYDRHASRTEPNIIKTSSSTYIYCKAFTKFNSSYFEIRNLFMVRHNTTLPQKPVITADSRGLEGSGWFLRGIGD